MAIRIPPAELLSCEPAVDRTGDVAMAHADRIAIERNGPVTTVLINRPEARNACTVDMVRRLHRAFAEFEADAGARVAVLHGVGGAFCSGADLREIEDGTALGYCWAGPDEGATRRQLDKPVLAAVDGPALAAGLALAVWCDLRVAGPTATFGVSCRRFGGPMPNGATVRLPRLIGQSHALDLMLTGRIIDAPEAHRIGLVNRLVDGDARAAAEALAHELAGMPAAAMLSDRRSLLRQWSLPEADAIRYEVEQGKAVFGADFRSGAARFVAGEGRHGDSLAPS
jgi:enoyl-CoA hydratase